MPPRSGWKVFGIAMLLGLSACSQDDVAKNEEGTAPIPPASYSSEVDGVSVRWPKGWNLVDEPLDVRPLSNNVELITLVTFDGAAAGQCAPDPDGAMAAMADGDGLIMLRASDGAGDPRPPRPENILTEPGVMGAGGCNPVGVESWRIQFQENGRPYEVFVAARALSAERRAEIEDIWDDLKLTPIDEGRVDAEIGRPYWHSLYTHCGIKDTTFDGRQWVAEPEQFDTPGNPPPGWGNPGEHGTIELKDPETAVFTSRDGERSATFRPRGPQDPPHPDPCQ